MESCQDSHDKRVFECRYILGHPFLFQTLICHRLFQSKVKLLVLTFGWPYNKGEDNRKPSSGRSEDGSGRSIGGQ